MSTIDTTRTTDGDYGRTHAGEPKQYERPAGFGNRQPEREERPPRGFLDRRRFTETKSAWKTTELLVFALAAAGIAIATWQSDEIDATRGWTLLTVLAVGYMIARGIAKAGKGVYDND